MSVVGVVSSLSLGVLIVMVGYRSKQPRRDLMLLLVPAMAWMLIHLILKTPPTGSPAVNALLIFFPLVAAFVFLARRWGAFPAE